MNSDRGTRPAYRIVTRRLVLRCWEPSDAPALNAALTASWSHLMPWMPFAQGEPPPLEDTLALTRRWRAQFDLDQDYVYGIFDADGRSVLGSTGLHTRQGPGVREIGYWVHVHHINRGYATEAAAALTKVAFEVDHVRKVVIRCLTTNERSAAVPRKLGFIHEATLRQNIERAAQEWMDAMIWTLLADEYPHTPASQAAIKAYDAMGRRLL